VCRFYDTEKKEKGKARHIYRESLGITSGIRYHHLPPSATGYATRHVTNIGRTVYRLWYVPFTVGSCQAPVRM